MRKVLILAYYFPPIAASGSLRPAGFCAHLPDAGYSPTVLSADYRDVHPPITIDNSLRDLVDEKLDIRLITYVNWQKRLLSLRNQLRKATGTTHSSSDGLEQVKNDDARDEKFNLKAEILARAFRFPDQQAAWGRAAYRYLLSASKKERPDVIFATGNPWSALVAGMRGAEKLGIPFVSDFRDPWVNNPKPPLTPSLGRKAERVEAKIVQNSTRIVANTTELAESFADRYREHAGKIVTITNGYHQSLANKFSELPDYEPQGTRVELCYFGSVYELRKPTLLLMALKELLDEKVEAAERLILRFTGNWIVTNNECNNLAEELEHRGAMYREAGVSHEKYMEKLKASQNLLILQQGFPLQIPAKLYEYMASGRPTIMIGGEGATANLIRRSGVGTVCANSKQDIKALLKSLSQNSSPLGEPIKANADHFAYSNLTLSLASTLDDAIQDYNENVP